jgi:hypothetical protein
VGNKLELLIRKAGRYLRDHQVAVLRKIPEEFQQTDCDFYGYTAVGRAILVEAKMVSRTRLPVGQSPGMASHQWVSLCEANRANVLALICWSKDETIATFDMDMAIELKENSKSIPWNAIPERFKHRWSPTVFQTMFEPYLCLPAMAIDPSV